MMRKSIVPVMGAVMIAAAAAAVPGTAAAQWQWQADPGQAMFHQALRDIRDQQGFDAWVDAFDWAGRQEYSVYAGIMMPWYVSSNSYLHGLIFSPSGAARNAAAAGGGGTRGGLSPERPVAITNIVRRGDTVSFGVAWLPEYPLPGEALDLYGTHFLDYPQWEHVREVGLPTGALAARAHAFGLDLVAVGRGWDWIGTGFFQIANKVDTDGDGLTDAYEILVTGTDPHKFSTVGDNIPDGWKLAQGFSPLQPGIASLDTDGDGLTNYQEYLFGTDPRKADTDGDGLRDSEEVGGTYRTGLGFVPFDVSGTAPVTGLFPDANDSVLKVALPFPAYFQGEWCTEVFLDVNGLIYVRHPSSAEVPPPRPYPHGMDGSYLASRHTVIAALWDDLQLYPAQMGSEITVADVTRSGKRYCVIEYRDMGFRKAGANPANKASFQVVLEQGLPNTAVVGYIDAAGYGNGLQSSLGIQAKRPRCGLPFRPTQPGIPAGLHLTYTVPAGTDPCNPDTDGDGLPDGTEVKSLGSNPFKYSTLGDGIADGWKFQFGFSLLDPSVADADPDNDGLSNFDEYRYCTNPLNPDTDGDGVSDGDEVPHSPGSVPNDPNDLGNPANCVTLALTVGDPSDSNSERWELLVFDAQGKLAVRHCDRGYGQPDTTEYSFLKGMVYTYRMQWVATNLEEPDYDWRCLVNGDTYSGIRTALYGTGIIIIEDPGDLLTTETHGNEENITIGREGRIIVPRFTFLRPEGDPATAPDLGPGQNQFTFSADNPGTLEILMLALAEPAEAIPYVEWSCQFKAGDIGSSAKAWKPQTPGGWANVGPDGGIDATVTYTRLPYHNDDFGWKMAELWCAGTLVASNRYGVFFHKYAKNHPACTTPNCADCPNWFYYWKEGGVCGIPPYCTYDPNEDLGVAHRKVGNYSIRLGELAADFNDGPKTYYSATTSVTAGGSGVGIQCVAEIIQHEEGHINIHRIAHDPAWHDPNLPYADNDGDGVLDALEQTLMGIATDPNNPNTFNVPKYPTDGDDEIRCRLLELNVTIPYYTEKDWAEPGCQHKNYLGPQVNP